MGTKGEPWKKENAKIRVGKSAKLDSINFAKLIEIDQKFLFHLVIYTSTFLYFIFFLFITLFCMKGATTSSAFPLASSKIVFLGSGATRSSKNSIEAFWKKGAAFQKLPSNRASHRRRWPNIAQKWLRFNIRWHFGGGSNLLIDHEENVNHERFEREWWPVREYLARIDALVHGNSSLYGCKQLEFELWDAKVEWALMNREKSMGAVIHD
jgi:hypothetical protein